MRDAFIEHPLAREFVWVSYDARSEPQPAGGIYITMPYFTHCHWSAATVSLGHDPYRAHAAEEYAHKKWLAHASFKVGGFQVPSEFWGCCCMSAIYSLRVTVLPTF